MRWRLILGLMLTGLLVASLLIWPGEAHAAGVCNRGGVALRPDALFPGSFILKNNLPNREFSGRPFSFRVKMAGDGFPLSGVSYKWYTFDAGYLRRWETPVLPQGTVVTVQTWCGGKRGADWVGEVKSK